MAADGQPVVVGYDGSEEGAAAVRWAAAEAGRRGVPLRAICAVAQASLDERLGDELSRSLATRPGLAERIAASVSSRVAVQGELSTGPAARALVHAARDASLLVVGTRGHDTLVASIVGSVARQVAGRAGCPVVVVRGDTRRRPGPGRDIVVGVDDPTSCAGATAFAGDLAAGTGARVVIVTAYCLPSTQGLGLCPWETETGEPIDTVIASAAHRVAAGAAAALRRSRPTLDVTETAVQGLTPDVLLAASADAGLLVLGTRGTGGPRGVWLGSACQHAIHAAPCPVAVVRS
jgi:nucleotide-binding universal stress UspA family protein